MTKTVRARRGRPRLHRQRAGVQQGKRHGTWKFKYLTGELMREGEYVDGSAGHWLTYYTDGSKQDEARTPTATRTAMGPLRQVGRQDPERGYDKGIREGTLKR